MKFKFLTTSILINSLATSGNLQAAGPAAVVAKEANVQSNLSWQKNSAVIPTSRTNEVRWNEFMARIDGERQAQKTDLLFLGDSITQGFRSHADIWNHYYGQRNALNGGIWGDSTQHLLWRLQNGNFRGVDPRLVVLLIGTNNGSNTSEEIAEGVEANVSDAEERFPHARILVLGIFPSSKDPNSSRRLRNQAANQLIAGLADNKRVFWLDLSHTFADVNGDIKPGLMRSDFLHLTRLGYESWAAAMEPTIRALLSASSIASSTTSVRKSGG